jgi:molecular chaperone HscA
VKPSYGLGDDQVASMLRDSFANAEGDMTLRALREARVDAERMVLATRSALAADGDLLDDAQREAIDSLIRAVDELIGQDDHRAINTAVEALAHGTEDFAAERMNRGIQRAFAGRTVDQI